MTAMRDGLVRVMFDIVAEAGLDRLSVRELAGRAEVSLGAVQHRFPTKDAMLSAAFDELVTRTHARTDGLTYGADVAATVRTALALLLPLDAARAAEARVHLAFAARAAVAPELAAVQLSVLGAVQAELTMALGDRDDAAATARLLLAAVDGLALHAVSAPGLLDACTMNALLDRLVASVVG